MAEGDAGMETSETVKEIRSRTGLNRKEFCQKFGIPLRTMEEWETGRRIPPEYIPRMLAYYTRSIDTDNARNEIRNHYDIVEDAEGNKVVIINDLRFKSRRNIDWNTVEQCLKLPPVKHLRLITRKNMWQMQNMDGIVMIHVLQYLYTTMREICADIISLAQGF